MQKVGDITSTATPEGEFTDGNVAGGVNPTLLMALWFNTIQRELCNVVTESGGTLDPNDFTQVVEAIKRIAGSELDGKGFLVASKNLSDVLDKTTVRQNIGLKTAAIADVTTSNIDTTGGRVLKVGDYGLTKAINVASGANVVTFLASAPGSFYHFDSSTSYTNAPNFGNNWFDVYITIHEVTNYRTIIAVSASGALAYAAITNGAFSGWSYPFTTTGGNLSGNLQISTAAPIIQMSETDTGKQYYIVVDGSGFRINEDSPSGKVVLAYSANSSKTTTTGQFVPADYGNFDGRYPVKDAITAIGLESDNVNAPYMRRATTGVLVYLAARDWVNGNFLTGVRLGAQTWANNNNSGWAMAPDGAVLTGSYQDASYTAVYYRYPQYRVNGTWYNIGVA